MNLLSPGYAFQYSLEALLGNGIARFRSFTRQGWDYRETLREFLRARDAADPDSPHVLFLGDYMSQEKLDPAPHPALRGGTPCPWRRASPPAWRRSSSSCWRRPWPSTSPCGAFNRSEVAG